MKRIAVASVGSHISSTLADAEGFRIYEFDGTTLHAVDYFDHEDLTLSAVPDTFAALGVVEFFSGNVDSVWMETFKAKGVKVVPEVRGEIADSVVGYFLEEILENKKRGMKPLSSCHSTNGSDH